MLMLTRRFPYTLEYTSLDLNLSIVVELVDSLLEDSGSLVHLFLCTCPVLIINSVSDCWENGRFIARPLIWREEDVLELGTFWKLEITLITLPGQEGEFNVSLTPPPSSKSSRCFSKLAIRLLWLILLMAITLLSCPPFAE